MHALESLRRDYRLLLQLTDALEAYVVAMMTERSVRRADLVALVHAVRRVADYRYFEKKEYVLHQVLVLNGFDWNQRSLLGSSRLRSRISRRSWRASTSSLNAAVSGWTCRRSVATSWYVTPRRMDQDDTAARVLHFCAHALALPRLLRD